VTVFDTTSSEPYQLDSIGEEGEERSDELATQFLAPPAFQPGISVPKFRPILLSKQFKPFRSLIADPRTQNPVPGYVHPAPGHSPDHVIYHVPSANLLFPGDAYLTPQTFFFRSDEDMDRIIQTCEYCFALPSWDIMLCAHEPVYSDGKEAMRKKLGYMINIREKILSLHDSGMAEEEVRLDGRLERSDSSKLHNSIQDKKL